MMKQEKLNEKLPTFLEVMEGANKADDPVKFLKEKIAKDVRITNILGYAFNPRAKIPLPSGIPPYIPSDVPLGLAEVEILHLFNKIYVLFEMNAKRSKKEEIYIRWLEAMNEKEAALMVSIKDQTLLEHFENLDEYHVVDALGWPRDKYDSMKKS